MKKIISLILSGFLSLTLVPHGFAAVPTGRQVEGSVLPAAVGAKAGLEEHPATIPCSRLPKGNVFQGALKRERGAWQEKNRLLGIRDLAAWNEAHQKFLQAVEERRKQHFDRVIQCTAMREKAGAEPGMREGTRLAIFYPSSITTRMELPERLAQTGMETAAQRESYFRRVREEGRKTRRTIREEHRERLEASVLP